MSRSLERLETGSNYCFFREEGELERRRGDEVGDPSKTMPVSTPPPSSEVESRSFGEMQSCRNSATSAAAAFESHHSAAASVFGSSSRCRVVVVAIVVVAASKVVLVVAMVVESCILVDFVILVVLSIPSLLLLSSISIEF